MEIQPFGEQAAWQRHGVQCALFANANAPKGKRFAPADFMPKPPRQPQTWQQMQQVMRAQLGHLIKPKPQEG